MPTPADPLPYDNLPVTGLTAAVTVGICTIGRDSLSDTVQSLALQDLPPGVHLKIVVADNGETPTAALHVKALKESTGLDIQYIHAPANNISIARNAILEAVRSDWLAFIDDDEVAGPGWVINLLERAQATGADAVFGPVRAIYAPDAPKWLRDGDFHSTDITFVSGKIITGYSCNVLMKLSSPYYAGLRFAPELGQSGGEDTVFFSSLHRRGGQLDYAPDAGLEEPVAQSRARFGWLFSRRFRSGQTHGRLILESSRTAIMAAPFLLVAKAGFCLGCALLTLPSAVPSRRWLLRGALHLGALARLLGVKDLSLYSRPRDNQAPI